MAKYSAKASEKVKTAMEEMKSGTLKSGRSNKKVTNPKQAVAIGLSEARQEGDKVPSPPKKKATPKKAMPKNISVTKGTVAKKSSTQKAMNAAKK